MLKIPGRFNKQASEPVGAHPHEKKKFRHTRDGAGEQQFTGVSVVPRFLCQKWFLDHYPQSFPWGTFVVNIVGCFLIGIFWAATFRPFPSQETWKLILLTGFCGGFTTFSSFTLDGLNLMRDQKTGLFILYTAISVILGLLATFAGIRMIRSTLF
ncbi:MAG: fluoride efflux transporter CrcB [Sphingobacteriales bacterium]|nr:MAG: fluoride efflux transporter CrcB [Sphingobacteriales bacterium]